MKPFWRGKKVLVTGHTGFKGAWLCLWLKELGADVTGFSKAPDAHSLFIQARVGDSMTSIIGDINDYALLKQTIDSHQPEIVFHLAAVALVGESYQNPVETYATNVMGTVHLLEAMRHSDSVKTLVNVTTDKCYANPGIHAFQENEPLGGLDPYSSSKACAELVTTAYRASYFKTQGIATARAGNVIGGGDWAQKRLIPDVMRSCLKGEDVLIRSPTAIRPWQHVLDALYGYLTLAQALHVAPVEFSEAWNFGPVEKEVKSVQWIVDYLLAQWGGGTRSVLDQAMAPHEAHILTLDCSKALSRLAWHPQNSLYQALDLTVAWYQAYQAGVDMRAFTLAQINRYFFSTYARETRASAD